MAKSLQEQLRQAGLASQKQAVKARKAKDTREKMQRKGVDVIDETAELVRQRDAEKLARDRALNEEKNRAAQARAIQAQIQQLIDLNAIADRGDTEYRFDHKGVIKTLMLQSEHRGALIRGSLAIVGQQETMAIVPRQVAEKIAERDDSWLIQLNARDDDTAREEDDDYAGYEVPDDLMW